MPITDGNSQKALGADVVASLYALNGAGLKIGIISDSYNNLGTAAGDVTSGDLPNNVTVVRDTGFTPGSPGTDEGRAMIELAYRIAPGATYFFASGASDAGSATSQIQTCANAVASLQAPGCNIIIDDLGFGSAEGFYQVGTVLDKAISTAVAAGISYFSAAGNDDKNFYEHGFKALQTTITGIGTVTANDFGSNNPYLSVTIPVNRKIGPLFEWAQPFASIGTLGNSAQNSLAIYLLDASGNIVASETENRVGGDPAQQFDYTNKTAGTAFRFVVVQNGGTVPTGQLFKILSANGGVTFNDPNANIGSGNIYGHELLTNQNSLAAVDFTQTPAFGVAPPTPTTFTSVGPGSILFDAQGNALATPVNPAEPNFAAPQGSSTAIPRFAPFNGTSAAAPNAGAVAALAIEANRNLTTTQVTSFLTQSAIPVATTLLDTGAGLIQARAAVELASAAAGARWTVAAGGNWTTAASWSTGAPPTTGQGALLDDNLGGFTASYTVTIDTSGNVAGSLAIGTPSTSSATLALAAGGAFAIGGSNATNPTANDLLVSNRGVLSVQGGALTVAGSLNVNNGTVAITSGSASANNVAQNSGSLSVGGSAWPTTLSLMGSGLNQTGGTVAIQAFGTLNTTSIAVSSAQFSVASTGYVAASGVTGFTSNTIFSDAGTFVTRAALNFDSTIATVLSNAALTAASITIDATAAGFNGALSIAGIVTDAGMLSSISGNAGRIMLQSAGKLAVGAAASNVAIAFAGGGTLAFGSTNSTVLTTQLTSLLSGFNNGVSAIDFTGLTYDATDTYTYSNGSLAIVLGSSNTTLANLKLDNTTDVYSAFTVARDAANGVLVKAVPCFCRGTLVATAQGEVAVEDLQAGDLVLTHSGARRPIEWIGRRAYLGHFAAGNPDVLPVLIRAGALEDGVPRRDLFVSPLHAMFLDGVLIPAVALINGGSITQLAAVDRVEYFHVELKSHDVILAEGAPAETFVDDDSRGMFHNARERQQPGAVRVPAIYCAPRIEDGEALERIRSRIAARADGTLQPAPGPLRGQIDVVSRRRIQGWAMDTLSPDLAVRLRVKDGDRVLDIVDANRLRSDLVVAGIGTGRHGFDLELPGGLSLHRDHSITVERVSDATQLKHSPWYVEAAPASERPRAVARLHRPDLLGSIDIVSRDRIAGWAVDTAHPNRPVALQLLVNGALAVDIVANQHRPDLVDAGFAHGRYAFDLALPGGLAPNMRHVIQILREEDGAELPGSPVTIEAAAAFDAGLQQAVARAVEAQDDPAGQGRALAFLLDQADRLRQIRADADARLAERTARQRARRRKEATTVAPALRALVIDESTPRADYDAGSQAVLSHMQALRRLGYAVSFAAAGEAGRPVDRHAIAALEATGITCCMSPFYSSVEDVLRRQAGGFDLVYLHRHAVAARYLALARAHAPRARILYNVADLHHLRLERQALVEASPNVLAASRTARMAELMATWSADTVLTHSTAEAALLRQAVPHAAVHVVPWALPTRRRQAGFARRFGVAFIGHYAHAPNPDAARWLLDTIMPLVWQADPSIHCTMIGSDMPAWLRSPTDHRIISLGHVADLAPVLDRMRLTVAPLRYGAGAKGKVLESLAAAVPCIMSGMASEGLALPATLQELVGQDAAALARLIVARHGDKAAHATAAQAGLAYVRESWSAAALDRALDAAIGSAQPLALAG